MVVLFGYQGCIRGWSAFWAWLLTVHWMVLSLWSTFFFWVTYCIDNADIIWWEIEVRGHARPKLFEVSLRQTMDYAESEECEEKEKKRERINDETRRIETNDKKSKRKMGPLRRTTDEENEASMAYLDNLTEQDAQSYGFGKRLQMRLPWPFGMGYGKDKPMLGIRALGNRPVWLAAMAYS